MVDRPYLLGRTGLNPRFSFQDQGSERNENERMLIQSLHQECIQIHGYVVKYVPRTGVKLDLFLGEDVLSKFDKSYDLDVWVQNYEGFGGNSSPAVISKLGIELRDELYLQVSSKEFYELVGTRYPSEGDLVYLGLTQELFEIKWVEHRDQFFPLAQQMTFKLRLEPFEYSNEKFDTGVPEVDAVEGHKIPDNILEMDEFKTDNENVADTALPDIDFTEKNPFGDRK